MAVFLYYKAPLFPYTPDSASYIEQARNLVRSGAAVETPYGLAPGNSDRVMTGLFPIGFPVIIASVSAWGFDAKDVIVWVSRLAAILLPWLLFFCFRNALGFRYALALAALTLSTPGVILYSPLGLTDVFGLAIAVSAISLALNARSALGFLFSGMLAGLAYAVKNVYLALLVAIGFYVIYLWFESAPDNRRAVAKKGANLIFGMAAFIIPLWIRNALAFGTINPYHMLSSTIGFVVNLRTYLAVLIKDLTAYDAVATYTAWSIPGLVALTICTAGFIGWFIRYFWNNLESASKKAVILSGAYILAGSGLVIAARTRYQWGEEINIRHAFQYTPFLLAILLAPSQGKMKNRGTRWLPKYTLGLILILAIGHVNFILNSTVFQKPNEYEKALLSAYHTGKGYLCNRDDKMFLASNWAYVFRINGDARVRQIEAINRPQQMTLADQDPPTGIIATVAQIQEKACGRPICVGVFPGRFGLQTGDFPLPTKAREQLQDNGWAVINNDSRGLVIQRP
jgi:hypothetical protein